MQLSKKQKTFPEFVAAFFKSRLNFEYFPKKNDIVDVFPKLWTLKNVIEQIQDPFDGTLR